jgi:hypothetical protein
MKMGRGTDVGVPTKDIDNGINIGEESLLNSSPTKTYCFYKFSIVLP